MSAAPKLKPVRPAPEEDLPPPTGTIFVLSLYVALLAAIWGGMYLTMLAR